MNNKRTAIAILVSGAFALILAVAFGNGAFDSYLRDSHTVSTLDVPVQGLDEPVNVESLDEMVIVGDSTPTIAVEDLPLEHANEHAYVSGLSGPGAARHRPNVAGTPLEVPGGTPRFATESALSYNPIRSHGVRSVHLRRNLSTVGQPHRPITHEHETFVIQEE